MEKNMCLAGNKTSHKGPDSDLNCFSTGNIFIAFILISPRTLSLTCSYTRLLNTDFSA